MSFFFFQNLSTSPPFKGPSSTEFQTFGILPEKPEGLLFKEPKSFRKLFFVLYYSEFNEIRFLNHIGFRFHLSVSMHIFLPLEILPVAEGFGINTNVFETNIINLTVVIAVVIRFVGGNLSTLLEERRNAIVKNLAEANQRAEQAAQKLEEAKAALELAKKKATQIREEGISRANAEIQLVVSGHQSRMSRLEEFKEETLQFYQQKALKGAYSYAINRIMTRVRERLNKGLDVTYHVIVNNFYVSRFTDYNP